MTEIDLIVSQIGTARRYTEGLLGAIDESDWFRMPTEGVTHIAWQGRPPGVCRIPDDPGADPGRGGR
jgi:hypothetical protein